MGGRRGVSDAGPDASAAGGHAGRDASVDSAGTVGASGAGGRGVGEDASANGGRGGRDASFGVSPDGSSDGDGGPAGLGGSCGSLDGLAPTVRLLAPLSTSIVTKRRPTLRWTTSAPCAEVDLCKDRRCTVRIGRARISGTSAVPAADLPPGIVFWRVRVRAGAQTVTSPTWEFWVGPNDTPVDSTTGTMLDVNGDGFADVVVGATGSAAVFLLFGGPGSPNLKQAVPPPEAGEFLPWVTTAAGDVNGDGFGDVAVSDTAFGRVYVYLGGADGLKPSDSTAVRILSGMDGDMTYFGSSVSAAGDVNGDGYADMVVGEIIVNRLGGAGYVYFGGPDGVDDSAFQRLSSNQKAAGYSYIMAGAGDVDGDGFSDVVVGEPTYGAPTGSVSGANALVRVYLGSAQGLRPNVPAAVRILRNPDGPDDCFACFVGRAGDVDGDGFADVLTGAAHANNNAGRVHLYNGGRDAMRAAVTIEGPDGPTSYFGQSLGGSDFNGDGFSDLAIGEDLAAGMYGPGGIGRAHVYLGSAAGPQHITDGMSPVFVGQGTIDEAFGYVVAGGGDVDGDGYGDLVVGANSATVDGVDHVGSVFVFRGTPAGPTTTAPIVINGDPSSSTRVGWTAY